MKIPQEHHTSRQDSSEDSFGTLPDETPNGAPASAPQDTAESPEAQTLHRVRELLFGETAQSLEQRVESLETAMMQRMAAMERDFDDRVKATEQELRTEWKAEIMALASKLNDQEGRKVERADLRTLLNDLAQRLDG